MKKPNLDTDEKLVMRRLEEHMIQYDLHNPLPSAYRSLHSTETAIMRINHDIISGLDYLTLTITHLSTIYLDLSAAFDTVDHSILT